MSVPIRVEFGDKLYEIDLNGTGRVHVGGKLYAEFAGVKNMEDLVTKFEKKVSDNKKGRTEK